MRILDIAKGQFPEMFENCGDEMIETHTGWDQLLLDLCHKLKAAEDKCGIPVKFEQIKPKYGQLCVYLLESCVNYEKIIHKACVSASKTCEVCGKPGKINKGPWYMVVCGEEHK